MPSQLPRNPSLENLKKQSKTLQKAWQANNAGALARIRAAHPQYARASDQQLRESKARLTDCQLVIAREAGFESWPQLKVAVESANQEAASEFVEIACLCHDDPHYDHRMFHARAHAMLEGNPTLAEASIWSAATAGNAEAVRTFLDRDPALVNRGGPHGWTPLFCACYSRVRPVNASHSTLEAAKVLLERGADPNTYTLKGNADQRLDQTARRFSVLAGLVGGGSTGLANQPMHPHWREIAELLLDRGADPADEMAISIRQREITHQKLEILLRHGLTPEARGKREGGTALMGRALAQAIHDGDEASIDLLLAHKARLDEPYRGKTPWQIAMERGHLELARRLEAMGAPVAELDDGDRFFACCIAGDERGARAILERVPDVRERVPKEKEIVLKAASSGRLEAVNLVLDLGFDPNFTDEVAALHTAAAGGREAVARLLMARGASLTIRDPFYDGTPLEWADFFDQRPMREMLLNEGAICLFDALDFDRLNRVPDILARDPEALERPFAKCLTREPSPGDWQTPLVRMVDRGKGEAVRTLLECGADAAAKHPDGRSLLRLARDKGFDEIAGLLAEHEPRKSATH